MDEFVKARAYAYVIRSAGSLGTADLLCLDPYREDPALRLLVVQCKWARDGKPSLPRKERLALEDLAAHLHGTAIYAHNRRGRWIVLDNLNTGAEL